MRMIARIAAIVLIATSVRAAGPEAWVPARWQGGPLEVLRRGAVDPSVATIIRDWYSPRTLDLLRDTPINCLLVTWSTGADAAIESEQQKGVAAYTRLAHERQIAVLGLIHASADARRAAAAALEAGLDGLVLDGDLANKPEIVRELRGIMQARPVVPLGGRNALSPEADWPVLGTTDAATPRVRTTDSDTFVATPSSEPWIDSNTWLIRSVRAWSGSRPVWLGNLLEKPSTGDYVRAIADAAVAGGRWVVALDDALLAGLRRGEPEAVAAWRQVAGCLRFYEEHPEWRSLEQAAVLGIIQDRAGENVEMSGENLNLINRRRIPYRVIDRTQLSQPAIEGLRALLATDLAPPSEAERKLLTAYAEKGGLVVTGPTWGRAGPGEGEYTLHGLGAGSVAIYKALPDPESLSKDMLDLIGSNNILVRLFNVPSVLSQAVRAPGGATMLVHLVNYATAPSEMITVRAVGEYRRARLFIPGAQPAEMKIDKADGKVEVRIARMTVNAALLLEK